MKLSHLDVTHCRGLRDGTYRFTQPDGTPHQRVVVTGASGTGKTTLLEVIAMVKEAHAPYGAPPDPTAFLRPGEATGTARLTLLLDSAERSFADTQEPVVVLEVRLSGRVGEPPTKGVRDLLRHYGHEHDEPKLNYIPGDRRLPIDLVDFPPPTVRDEARVRLRRDARKYEGVVPWLRRSLIEEASEVASKARVDGLAFPPSEHDTPLTAFRARLAAFCPWLRLVGLDTTGHLPQFERLDGTHPRLDHLADAERDAVLLASEGPRLGLRRSVIVIDRPDLHAHPRIQPSWLDLLAADDNQVIAATSSPALISAVPASAVIELG